MLRYKSTQCPIFQQSNCWKIALAILGLSLFSASCSSPPGQSEGVYLPPTRAGAANSPLTLPEATVLPEQASTLAALPTPTPPCVDNLRYVEDQSIPDGSLVTPGELLDKRWLVENNGSCNWDAGYRLKLSGGPDLGAAAEQALFPARSGTQAVIRIVFTAPTEPGAYRSAWQAYSPDGQAFGDLIFIEIQVEG
jgi:hypothetical protein